MVEKREGGGWTQKAARGKVLRVALAVGLGMSFAAACREAGVNIDPIPKGPETLPDSATQPSAAIEVTPTAETLPASLSENLPALKKLGYTLQQGERGWELVSPQGQLVVSTADTLTVTAYGADNELIVSPEAGFGITETIGAGMRELLTLKNSQGAVTHTFLERAGYWAALAEVQSDPREVENYPQVPIEALWNGQLAQSEALSAEPFPAGTLVPESFEYFMHFGAYGYRVSLQNRVEGRSDKDPLYRMEVINKDNHYRRFTSFYRSITAEGIEVVIGTEQVMMPDGETSLFLHYVFGPEWSWEENTRYGSGLYNLVDSVFLGHAEPPQPGMVSTAQRPTIYSASYADGSLFAGSVTNQPNAAIELYSLPQNKPVGVREDLEELFKQEAAQDSSTNRPVATAAEDELIDLQFMGFASTWVYNFFSEGDIAVPAYFGSN